jgi:SAM-dependent methyltransferase
MNDNSMQDYWDHVYSTKKQEGVSWFEATPKLSLDLINATGIGPSARVVDVGGGASRLVDFLIARDQRKIAVLDISSSALKAAKARLGELAERVEWIVTDVTLWRPDAQYDIWHDRAAFHFLTDPADQAAYAAVLARAIRPSSFAIIGTFAPDGPERCSGLPVARHNAASLAKVLGDGFELQSTMDYDHHTPSNAVQRFQFSTFRKR